ncbi:hypothetical protein GCM10029978_066350 [Actinoallomurus acanthiterrae]
MIERLRDVPGDALSVEDYLADFSRHFNDFGGSVLKLERRQAFREPEDPSWRALDAGDWREAIRLIDGRRDDIQDPVLSYPDVELRRLRIVDKPYTPYLQWELYYIRLRAEAGEQIHILDAGSIRHLEQGTPLPETVIIGSQIMYEVIYDDNGDLRGARKITDTHVVQATAHDIHGLFVTAKTLQMFYAQEPTALPPLLQAEASNTQISSPPSQDAAGRRHRNGDDAVRYTSPDEEPSDQGRQRRL